MICLTGDAGVGTLGLVTITGEVRFPRSYALRAKNERLADLLNRAGGLRPQAYAEGMTGAVNAAGSVLWRRGAGLSYYISAAGGYARNADDGRTSVRYATGEVRRRGALLFFSSSPTPDPGAEVFVPGKDPADRKDWTSLVGILASTASILASTAAVIIAVTR